MPSLENKLFDGAYHNFRRGFVDEIKTGINENDQILFHYRNIYRQELNSFLEQQKQRFWVSQDIGTTVDVTVQPQNIRIIPVSLPRSFLPIESLNNYAFSCVFAATRSRFAQLGLEVLESSGNSIAQTIIPIENGKTNEGFIALVPVFNHSARPIHLPETTKFFYLYYSNGALITGKNLKELIGKEIKIGGKEGYHYNLWTDPRIAAANNPVRGIELLIDPKSRRWIKPQSIPITISDDPMPNHNRAQVDSFLEKPIPRSKTPIFWVAQTLAEVELDNSIVGLMDTIVETPNPINRDFIQAEYQTNSLIIRNGFSGRIRTEIVSRTIPSQIPKKVLLTFARA